MLQYTCWLILVDCFNAKCYGFFYTNPQLLRLRMCSLEDIGEKDKVFSQTNYVIFLSLFLISYNNLRDLDAKKWTIKIT
jgi:hypothetical protein